MSPLATTLTKQEGEEYDDTRGAERLPTEDKRAHRLRNTIMRVMVMCRIRFSWLKAVMLRVTKKFKETEPTITQDKEADLDILASVACVELDNRQRRQDAFDVTTMVSKGASHNWRALFVGANGIVLKSFDDHEGDRNEKPKRPKDKEPKRQETR